MEQNKFLAWMRGVFDTCPTDQDGNKKVPQDVINKMAKYLEQLK